MFYIFMISLVFISIAIVRNKNGEYLKQAAFTCIVFSILNCLILARLDQTGNMYHYFGTEISYGMGTSLFIISIIMTLLSLIVYLFTDADR